MKETVFKANPYSLSEFVRNYYSNKHTPKGEQLSKLERRLFSLCVWRLLTSLEYRRKKTNNHILNNFSAIAILGVILSNKWLIKFGLSGFYKWYVRLSANNCVSEGSSHYSLIFFSWVSEISLIATSADFKIRGKLKSFQQFATSMASACEPFLSLTPPVVIGDVSPDELMSISIAKAKHYRSLLLQSPNNVYGYHSSKNQDGVNWVSDKKSVVPSYVGLISSIRANEAMYLNHQHVDGLSFFWGNKGIGTLIDPGRYTYDKNCHTSALQLQSASHTSMSIRFDENEVLLIPKSVRCDRNSIAVEFSDNKKIFGRRIIQFKGNGIKIEDSFNGIDELDENLIFVEYAWVHMEEILIKSSIGSYSLIEQNSFIVETAPLSLNYGQLETCYKTSYSVPLKITSSPYTIITEIVRCADL